MKYKNLQEKIENINLDNLSEDDVLQIETTIKELDNGNIRVVNNENGEWSLNEWVRDAILLFFSIRNLKEISANDLIYYDKLEPKKNYKDLGIRVVPPGVVRYGAFCEPGVVVMPGFVNIGAYVGSGTMVDTWATVGSCAQIGKNVHLSGGAGIGGVLEPLQAGPVIIEDDCFIGARSEVVEGVVVEQGAVLSMGVFIGASTKIVDRETGEIHIGRVPAYSVVVPGSLPGKPLADGSPGPALSCAVIIKKVDEKTRAKTSVNDLLRD